MSFEIVQLRFPYKSLSQERGQMYFSQCLAARIKSYQTRYGENVFPLGCEDFIADHIMIYFKNERGEKQIVGTFKMVNYETCQRFGVAYPLLHTLSDTRNPTDYYERTKIFLGLREKNIRPLCYIGGLTINTQGIDDASFKQKVKDLISTCLYYSSLENNNAELLVTGSIPNKSCIYLQWLGLTHFFEEPVVVRDIGETTAFVMHLDQWSEDVRLVSESCRAFWRNRSEIRDNEIELMEKNLAS